VLTGDMSLVGPRPALPDEVARFDEELLGRTRMRPGITGLWQVEARDNPSFSAYRRLDLFYVDNWSVTLDIVIMLATVEQVIARAVTMVFQHAPKVEPTCLERPEEPETAAA
jgi:lipopolysaccharide/colanic/teichoic acid biosynthesis glycosyltransferase